MGTIRSYTLETRTYVIQNSQKWSQLGQLNQVEPGNIRNPFKWFWTYCREIKGGTTCKKIEK